MPRLPDRFDLWVRRARDCSDPERQLDYVLGALMSLPDWLFLNLRSAKNPQPATLEAEGGPALLVFSDLERLLDIARERGVPVADSAPPVIAIPSAAALKWCIDQRPMQAHGLLVNPGEDNALIPLDHAATFEQAWRERGALQASGFWIPNLTSEEEDFWQEHGL